MDSVNGSPSPSCKNFAAHESDRGAQGVSTGDFSDAWSVLVGEGAPGLSAATVTRLKGVWQGDYEAWTKRRFEGKRYVYISDDGIYFNVRLGEDERMCVLVIMGALWQE